MIGETISHYRIIDELGRGGMGVVYAAEDTKLGRKVALKVLAQGVAADHERVQRFIREAQAASAINHPNIATIYEIDEVDGLTFIAMEFIEGETLRQRISAGIPSYDEILDLARQIARALGSAHEQGIVHRDVKPENIVVRPDGLVKILDFGLAKLMPQPESADRTRAMSLTREGAVMGTAQYMSPEQARGMPVDARTDVFAAGAVLYEMATGQVAFAGESQLDVLYAIVNEPPQPLPDDAGVPDEFQAVVAKALSKDPEERFENCCEMAEALSTGGASDLRTIVSGSGPLEQRKPPAWRRWAVPAVVAVLVVLVTVVGVRMSRGGRGFLDPSDLTYTPLTGDGYSRSSAISPDGSYLAYTPMKGEQTALMLKQIDTGSESVLVPRGPYGIRSPVFSPDGTMVYYTLAGPDFSMSADGVYDLYRVSMLGGEPLLVAESIIGRRFALSLDGGLLTYKRVSGDSTRIFASDAIGANERVVAVEPLGLSVDCCLAWSEEGDAVVTAVRDTATASVSIVSIPLEGGPARPAVAGLWQAVLDLHTLANGSGLLVVGCPVSDEKVLNINLWHVPAPGDAPRQITNDITNYYQVSSNAAGNKLALTFYAAKRTLRLIDVANGGHHDVSTDVVANGRVAWATDGRLIANQRVGNRIGLVSFDVAAGSSDQIVTGVDYVSELDVSPDGQEVVFTSFEGSSFSLYTVPLDGRAPRPTRSDSDEMDARYSPDGTWLATMRLASTDSPWVIARRDLDGSAISNLCEVSGRWPRISPDGARIAAYFLNEATGRYNLGLIPSEGGEPEFLALAAPYRLLDWGRGEDALTCYLRDSEGMVIDNVPLDGGEPRRVARMQQGWLSITDADWSRSGDSLAVCLQSATFDVTLLQGS